MIPVTNLPIRNKIHVQFKPNLGTANYSNAKHCMQETTPKHKTKNKKHSKITNFLNTRVALASKSFNHFHA